MWRRWWRPKGLVEVQNRLTDGNRFPASAHLQSRVTTRQEAEAFMAAAASSTAPTRTRPRINLVLPSGNSRPHLTIAQQARSAGAFGRTLPASVGLSPSPIASIPSHTPSRPEFESRYELECQGPVAFTSAFYATKHRYNDAA